MYNEFALWERIIFHKGPIILILFSDNSVIFSQECSQLKTVKKHELSANLYENSSGPFQLKSLESIFEELVGSLENEVKFVSDC